MSTLRIEHQCPQCGAPAELEETDRLFSCPFCRVRSFLAGEPFCYALPHNAPAGKDLLLVPYWRFKGTVLRCTDAGLSHRILDLSYCASTWQQVPATLGLRSQTLKLRFLDPDTEATFLPTTLGRDQVLEQIEFRDAGRAARPLLARAFVGDSLSRIYAAFYLEDGQAWDAVLNRPALPGSAPRADAVPEPPAPGAAPDWRLRFLPALCPRCGWDLEGDRDTLVLACGNCARLWMASGTEFVALPCAHLPPPGDAGEVCYLPFWRIRADVDGVELATRADLVRLANLPRLARPGEAGEPFHFWAAAFKIRPRDFLRLALQVTLVQPRERPIRRLPPAPYHAVTLPVGEAAESLKLVLASVLKPQSTWLPRLPGIAVRERSLALVFVPFRAGARELVHAAYQLCIPRNVLRHARHL